MRSIERYFVPSTKKSKNRVTTLVAPGQSLNIRHSGIRVRSVQPFEPPTGLQSRLSSLASGIRRPVQILSTLSFESMGLRPWREISSSIYPQLIGNDTCTERTQRSV